MKKLIITIACMSGIAAFAQDGFFLQPEMGAGNAIIKDGYPVGINPGYYADRMSPVKNVFSYRANVLAGYKSGHWSMTTGISFLRTGYHEDNLELSTGGWYGYWNYKVTQYYYHLSVPFTAAYEIKAGRRFSVSPAMGVAMSYNVSSSQTMDLTNFQVTNPDEKHTLTNSEFNKQYHRISGWGILKVQAEYRLSERVTIICGPEAQCMLTSFQKHSDVNATRNHAYTFNAGVTWHLKKKTNIETKSNNPTN